MPQNSARACVCVCVSVHMLERLIMQTLCYSCYVQLFQHNQSEQTAADIQLERLIRQTLQLLQLLCSVVPTQPKRANGRRHPAGTPDSANPMLQLLQLLQLLCSVVPTQPKRAKCGLYTDAAAPDNTPAAPLYTAKARKRPQTSSKVRPSRQAKRANGRRHPAKCTPLHKQSEQTAADIQQSAPCTQVKRANCRRHPSQGACCRHLLSLPPPPSTPPR